MTQAVQQIIHSIHQLSHHEIKELVDALVQNGVLTEDQEDIVIAESREGEPTMPADQVFEDLRRDGKL